MSLKRSIEKGVRLENVPLAPFTTWQVGGPAERFYWPLDLEDLQNFLSTLPDSEPLTFMGLGSNVLIHDEGIAGTVIVTQGALKEIQPPTPLPDNHAAIYAQAGVPCAQLARFAARHQCVSGEFWSGVPGSVGGALFMNAGAFGDETWKHVISVETINRHGQLKKRLPAEFTVHYRQVEGLAPDEYFVSGLFQFQMGNGEESLNKIKSLLERRSQTQPSTEPSCGSVFKNPPGDYAGRLIESLGLKGYQMGGAQISTKHANFIVNRGGAKTEDMVAVIRHIQERVKAAYGIELQTEVRWLGFDNNSRGQ